MKESPLYEEIMMEGRIEAHQVDVLEALQLRFGPEAATKFEQEINGISDLATLSQLHRRAI